MKKSELRKLIKEVIAEQATPFHSNQAPVPKHLENLIYNMGEADKGVWIGKLCCKLGWKCCPGIPSHEWVGSGGPWFPPE